MDNLQHNIYIYIKIFPLLIALQSGFFRKYNRSKLTRRGKSAFGNTRLCEMIIKLNFNQR